MSGLTAIPTTDVKSDENRYKKLLLKCALYLVISDLKRWIDSSIPLRCQCFSKSSTNASAYATPIRLPRYAASALIAE